MTPLYENHMEVGFPAALFAVFYLTSITFAVLTVLLCRTRMK